MENISLDLPEWDLTDLYGGDDSPDFDQELASLAPECQRFAQQYQGKLLALAAEELSQAITDYEILQEKIGRLMSFAYLQYAGDMTDPARGQLFQNAQEKVNLATSDLLFFVLDLNRIDDEKLQELLAHSQALNRYQPWLRDVRLMRPYQLDENLEKLLHEKDVAGRSAWVRLFDETLSALKIPFDGADQNLEQVLNHLSDADRHQRAKAAQALAQCFDQQARLFTHITNALAVDKMIEDRWRKLPSPQLARHLSNQVEAEVVDALVAAVNSALPRLSHRYYAMKAKWLGLETLQHFDRNAPLPEVADNPVPWPQAVDLVLEAYRDFSPELAALGKKFFDANWIDAAIRPGKQGGAFAHPTVPSAHPYLMLNYLGKTRDVMTLAHELGHGVHQLLAAPQGALMSDTPLTLAETASVFGEQLTFRRLLKQEQDPKRRKALLAAKVEDMLNTVVRQIAFYQFESKIHAMRAQSELTTEQISDVWMEVQSMSLGPAFDFDESYRNYWLYISHFIHSPFYVYAYAFGDCLVNSLYAIYLEKPEGFTEKYFELLKAGGTLRHKELLAPFGLDATSPGFWDKGLRVLEKFIDELAEFDDK